MKKRIRQTSAFTERLPNDLGIVLFSYNRPVAFYDKKANIFYREKLRRSTTTSRHCSEFCVGVTYELDDDLWNDLLQSFAIDY